MLVDMAYAPLFTGVPKSMSQKGGLTASRLFARLNNHLSQIFWSKSTVPGWMWFVFFIPLWSSCGRYCHTCYFPRSLSGLALLNNKNAKKLLTQGLEAGWHLTGLKLDSTPVWPEGHYFQCGFSVDARSVLDCFIFQVNNFANENRHGGGFFMSVKW